MNKNLGCLNEKEEVKELTGEAENYVHFPYPQDKEVYIVYQQGEMSYIYEMNLASVYTCKYISPVSDGNHIVRDSHGGLKTVTNIFDNAEEAHCFLKENKYNLFEENADGTSLTFGAMNPFIWYFLKCSDIFSDSDKLNSYFTDMNFEYVGFMSNKHSLLMCFFDNINGVFKRSSDMMIDFYTGEYYETFDNSGILIEKTLFNDDTNIKDYFYSTICNLNFHETWLLDLVEESSGLVDLFDSSVTFYKLIV